jgi:hypothetical protein
VRVAPRRGAFYMRRAHPANAWRRFWRCSPNALGALARRAAAGRFSSPQKKRICDRRKARAQPKPMRRAGASIIPEPGRGLDFMDTHAGSWKGAMGFPKQIRQFPTRPRYGASMTAQDAFAERRSACAAVSTPRAQQRTTR